MIIFAPLLVAGIALLCAGPTSLGIEKSKGEWRIHPPCVGSVSVEESWAPGGGRTGAGQFDSRGAIASIAYGSTKMVNAIGPAGEPLIQKAFHQAPVEHHYESDLMVSTETSPGPGQSLIATFAYDSAGRRTLQTNSLDHTVNETWNSFDRLATQEIQGFASDSEEWEFDDKGAPTKRTQGASVWTYETGPNSEILQVANAGTNVLAKYNYFEDLLLESIDPGTPGQLQTFAYDELSRPTLRTRGLAMWTTGWDAMTASVTEPEGETLEYRLDGRGREYYRKHTGATGLKVESTYDGRDLLLSVLETNAHQGTPVTTHYGYDATNLTTSIARGNRPTVTYSNSGDVPLTREASYGDTRSQTKVYDGLGRLSSIDIGGSDQWVFTYENNNPQLKSFTGPHGTHQVREYFAGTRLLESIETSQGAISVASLAYTYDTRGNRTAETFGNSDTRTFGYDEAERLTSVTYADGSGSSFAYNPDGSRLSQTRSSGEILTYGYNDSDGLSSVSSSAAGGTSYSVVSDAKGRVTSNGLTGRSYTWDAADRLISDSDGNEYFYDAFGMRIGKNSKEYTWGESGVELEDGLMHIDGFGVHDGSSVAVFAHDAIGSVIGRIGPSTSSTTRYDVFGGIRSSSGLRLRMRLASPHTQTILRPVSFTPRRATWNPSGVSSSARTLSVVLWAMCSRRRVRFMRTRIRLDLPIRLGASPKDLLGKKPNVNA